MSNEALTAVSKSSIRPSGRKFVLMALADYADENWSCFPSVAQLAQYTDQGEKTVRDHLDALEEAGIISRKRDRRDDGTLGRYRFVIQRRNLPVANFARGEKQPKPAADFATHNPHSNHQSNSSLRDEEARARFAELWKVFPLRSGQSRKTALKAFLALSDRVQIEAVEGGKRRAAQFEADCVARGEARERALQFVPALVRWIEEEGWQDALADDARPRPEMALVAPGTPDFEAVMRHMGNRVRPGKSGALTVLASDLEAARMVMA